MGSATADTEEETQFRVRSDDDPLVEVLKTASSEGAAFWRQLCPWLHVEDEAFCRTARQLIWPYAEGDEVLAEQADTWSDDLVREGYIVAQPSELVRPWCVDVAGVAKGIETLVAAGLPPSCILAYDECWAMAAQLEQLVRIVSGGNEPIMDWAAFHVKASSSSASCPSERSAPAGWPPHRDRGSDESVPGGFRTNGTPRYTTFWLALTDATPQSSCLMVVPRARDPGYSVGDKGKSPLTTIFNTPETFQHIRALPVQAGGFVAFSHRLLHWGSAADPRAPKPRIAVAFAAADAGFAEPYFSRSELPFPSLGLRLALVAGQALAYCANENLVTTMQRADMFWDLFRAQAKLFGPAFSAVVAKHRAYLQQTLPGGAELAPASTQVVEEKEEAVEGNMEDLFAGL
eukprot:TRINITY_DN46650_c0_g1_i1.p1 TRINITY_DN46650_c0_g1~~TRINITY_DN46650_c0_g1_i1.p1  ORF type:complete len:410 (-),score=100.66 TRINITY_DN46650_c0_g1_i1:262-1470(-)